MRPEGRNVDRIARNEGKQNLRKGQARYFPLTSVARLAGTYESNDTEAIQRRRSGSGW